VILGKLCNESSELIYCVMTLVGLWGESLELIWCVVTLVGFWGQFLDLNMKCYDFALTLRWVFKTYIWCVMTLVGFWNEYSKLIWCILWFLVHSKVSF
jgi:hypothetical protein